MLPVDNRVGIVQRLNEIRERIANCVTHMIARTRNSNGTITYEYEQSNTICVSECRMLVDILASATIDALASENACDEIFRRNRISANINGESYMKSKLRAARRLSAGYDGETLEYMPPR